MKKILFLLLLIPSINFSQEIVGIWVRSPRSEDAIEFTADGKVNFIDLKTNESVSKNLKATYKLESEDGIKYLIQTTYLNDKIVNTRKAKYKLENGKLYLPNETESNGVITVSEYKDEWIRIK